jgi:hypothetical protein
MVNGGRSLVPKKQSKSVGKSILADVDALIDLETLDITTLPALIEAMYEKIEGKWRNSKYRSKENWRLEKQLPIGNTKQDERREVSLERAIVNIPKEVWPDAANWFNQVPVASGLVDPDADRRRSIDLVHKCSDKDRAYEFIELKVASNTPLYAAMEILKYGLLYIFARKHPELFNDGLELLQAKRIELKVLAPHDYYKVSDFALLQAMEERMNEGLKHFLKQMTPFGLDEMKFSFEQISLVLERSSPWTSKRTT